ncbi:DnaJ-domain-containing protein, partial [Macroventuria anomochaeta]
MGDTNTDLQELARSTNEDYYELLGVPFDAEEAVIKRAYRKASIRYHPDKNPDSKDAADKFIALGWARDILIDSKLKAEYDRARTRRREKAFQEQLLSGNRRKMKEELERRERESADFGPSLKRKRAADMGEAERREQEIQRLAEDGKRRRKEAQDRKDKARKEEEVATAEPVKSPQPQAPKPGQSAELDRTIKIRFHREGDSTTWHKETVRNMFEKYGKIDSIIMGKDKKLKLEGEKHRKLVAMVFVVYGRLDHAHAAVSDAKADYPALDSVAWANGEPDLTSTNANGASTSTSVHPAAPSAPATPAAKSFRASFGSSLGAGAGATPLGTPKFSFSPKTPSLEEVTMMRLKNAEKKRLEEQIRKREAAEAAQE